MLQGKIIVIAFVLIVLVLAPVYLVKRNFGNRDRIVNEHREKIGLILNEVHDIESAKTKLIEEGYRIYKDPHFPTVDKSYYSMIVDLGIRRNQLEVLGDAFGFYKNQGKIFVLIKAKPSGKIYAIE